MPITAPVVNVYRGDTTSFAGFRFRGPAVDAQTPGPVLDVSGWDWSAQWRATPDSTEFLPLTLALDQADEGYVFVSATSDVTAQMNVSGVWDLQAVLPDGTVETKVRGKTKLVEDVTRG